VVKETVLLPPDLRLASGAARMGIYDRDYYRKDGPSFLGSVAEQGRVCKWLIAINVIVFVLQIVIRPAPAPWYSDEVTPSLGWVTDTFILDIDKVMHGQVWRLLTYAFLHEPGSLWHILFNMLFLWWFGKEVEDIYGQREFLAFYLVSAFLGGAAYLLWGLGKPPYHPCLGASGAVTACMVLFACHYPRHTILLFMFIPVPIWIFVAFQVAQDTFYFVSGLHTTTAVVVHLAGAAFGLAYYKFQFRVVNFWPQLRGWQRRRGQPRLRVYHEERQEPVSVAAPSTSDVDEHLEAKMDAVLEKVKKSGLDSLTEHERQILVRASEVYRKKRT
jgi:membrane associated rhomboid family serine protease